MPELNFAVLPTAHSHNDARFVLLLFQSQETYSNTDTASILGVKCVQKVKKLFWGAVEFGICIQDLFDSNLGQHTCFPEVLLSPSSPWQYFKFDHYRFLPNDLNTSPSHCLATAIGIKNLVTSKTVDLKHSIKLKKGKAIHVPGREGP
jgi:hypothetical protein